MIRHTRMLGASTLALLFTAFGAAPALAQVCMGFPTQPGQHALAMSFNTLTGGERYGAEGNLNLLNEFALFAGVGIEDSDIEEVGSTTSAGVGAAILSQDLGEMLGGDMVACPNVSLLFADVDNTDLYSIPVGLGFGTSYSLGTQGDMGFHPYLIPSLVVNFGGEETDTDFQFSLGANVDFDNRFYVGGAVNRIFIQNADSEFQLALGLTF